MHSSYLQLGHLHIPIFGIFAALGLMSALALSLRTARYAGLAPDPVWNTITTAALATFIISRILLVAFNLHSFLEYPLLILALPSITSLGIVLTAIFMLGYIRWRKLPLLPLLDAVAPCAALLWAFLSLGQYFGGTRDGMPANSWLVPSSATAARPEPVELLTTLCASLIFFRTLTTLRKQQAESKPGAVTATALAISGLVLFFLDFYRLPSDLFPNSPLDPSQIIGIAMILVGAALLLRVQAQIKPESGNEPPHAV